MIKGNPFGTEQNGDDDDDDYYMRWKELRLEKCEWAEWAKWAILCCCAVDVVE